MSVFISICTHRETIPFTKTIVHATFNVTFLKFEIKNLSLINEAISIPFIEMKGH